MNKKHLDIRRELKEKSHDHAIEYIKSFSLLKEEELFLIEHDVNDISYVKLAELYNVSASTINRRRRKAFAKIADGINRK